MREKSHLDMERFASTQNSSKLFNWPIWLPKRMIVVPLLIMKTNLPPITAGGGTKSWLSGENIDLETRFILTFSTLSSVILSRPYEL